MDFAFMLFGTVFIVYSNSITIKVKIEVAQLEEMCSNKMKNSNNQTIWKSELVCYLLVFSEGGEKFL